jgi:protein TonB
MYRPSLLLAGCFSFGLHIVAFSGASFLLPNADSNMHGPIEVVLVELSKPVDNSGDPSLPAEEKNSALPKVSRVEPETANDTVTFQEQRYDVEDVPAAVEEPAANPTKIVLDSHVPENSVVYSDRVVALPADVTSSNLDEMSGRMRPDVQYLSSTPPRYPRLARKRGWEGTVLLEVEVLSSGNVGTIIVARSSGHRVLDRAAQKAVEKWQFSVNRTDGSGVTATVEIPVTFTLDTPSTKRRG